MRSIILLLVILGIGSGCSLPKNDGAQVAAKKPQKITQQPILVGKVVSVKTNLDFAILNFPVGTILNHDQRLNIYRDGSKVGEVKVTGPRQNDDIIVDIISGEAKPGDEIRAN